MKNKLRNKKGITLIALVITIIVLLILAGVSITMISSQDGILKKATSAKDAQKNAQDKESSQMAAMENMMEYETIETVTDVSKLTTELPKMTKYVDNTSTVNKEAIIPRGFKVSGVTEEQKIDTGLVVIDKNGNEFVWVPVPNAIYDGKTAITVGTYAPMARKIGETENYQGILYDLDQTIENQKVYDLSRNGVGTTGRKEPSLITGNVALMDTIVETGFDAEYYNLAGNYSDAKAFGKDMQDEYNNMVKSVAKYGGFYVGRYETGIDNVSKIAVSKDESKTENNIKRADPSDSDTNMWYGLYNKQRTMAKDNGLNSVESSMIWGSQYDAMMIWMQKTGTIVGTGYSTNDIINKVCNFYGNGQGEWTLEGDERGRIIRAGTCSGGGISYSPSFRDSYDPDVPIFSIHVRLSLYIK